MTISKEVKWIFIYLIIGAILLVNGIIFGIFLPSNDIYRFSLFHDLFLDIDLFSILYFTAPFIGFFISYIISPFFLRLHRTIYKSKYEYAIENCQENRAIKLNFLRIFFPALFCINLSLILAEIPAIREFFIKPSMLGSTNNAVITMMTLIPLIGITAIISLAIFTAIYFLIDSGIIFIRNKEKEKNTHVQNVGSWILNVIRGYAGISVIFTFYQFHSNLITAIGFSNPLATYGTIALWTSMPFIITGLFIPVLSLLHIKYTKRKEYILKKAEKLGINSKFDIIIKKL